MTEYRRVSFVVLRGHLKFVRSAVTVRRRHHGMMGEERPCCFAPLSRAALPNAITGEKAYAIKDLYSE